MPANSNLALQLLAKVMNRRVPSKSPEEDEGLQLASLVPGEEPQLASLVPPEAKPEPAPTRVPDDIRAHMEARNASGLQEAQDEASSQRMIAGVGKASSTFLSRMAGAKPETSNWDAMAQDADRPVREHVARKAEAEAQAKAAKEAALDDPNSPASQNQRRAMAEMFPELAKRPGFASVPARELENYLRHSATRHTWDTKAAAEKAAADKDARDFGLREKDLGDRAEDRDLQRQMMERQEAGRSADRALQRQAQADARAEAAHARRELVQGKRDETDVQKLGKDLEEPNRMRADVETLKGYAATEKGKDMPGAGLWDSVKPQVLESADDTKFLQAARGAVGRLIKEQSGAAATEAEVSRKMAEYGIGRGNTEAQSKAGVQKLYRDAATSMRNTESKYRPEVKAIYEERGGGTSRSFGPAAGAPAPAKSGGGLRIYDKNGQPFDAPSEAVRQKALASGRYRDGP